MEDSLYDDEKLFMEYFKEILPAAIMGRGRATVEDLAGVTEKAIEAHRKRYPKRSQAPKTHPSEIKKGEIAQTKVDAMWCIVPWGHYGYCRKRFGERCNCGFYHR